MSTQALPTNVDDLSNSGVLPQNHPIIPHLVQARTSLLDNLSMHSDALMERLLDLPSSPSAYLTIPAEEILRDLRAATLRSEILPVVCGSAFKHMGTELLLNYVGALLPSPIDSEAKALVPNAPLQMLAWKVTWDKRRGWMTFVRVYSGKTLSSIRRYLSSRKYRYTQTTVYHSQRNTRSERKGLKTTSLVRLTNGGSANFVFWFRRSHPRLQIHSNWRYPHLYASSWFGRDLTT